MNTSLNGIKFGIDSSGNYGYYKVGADTVTPFKTGEDITNIQYVYRSFTSPTKISLPTNWKVIIFPSRYCKKYNDTSENNYMYGAVICVRSLGKMYGKTRQYDYYTDNKDTDWKEMDIHTQLEFSENSYTRYAKISNDDTYVTGGLRSAASGVQYFVLY